MKQSLHSSPPSKRVKLEYRSPSVVVHEVDDPASESENYEDQCSICLHHVVDRTVVPNCAHEFCFECLMVWSEQSRRCPLCSQSVGEYLIHNIRSKHDYQKHYLPPLRTSPEPSRPLERLRHARDTNRTYRRAIREREWGRRERQDREEADALERAITRRRWIYEHDLYAKHVASNSYTRYRPYPTPAQFAAAPELISRTTTFLRRELRVWVNLDVEFLTTFIISIMKAIDIRSESAVKLLAEFLDMDAPYVPGGRHVNAEHFAHEVYSYVRSPYKDLFVYDTIVQYEAPPHVPPPPEIQRSRRWRSQSRSRSHSRHGSPRPQQARNASGSHAPEREDARSRPDERVRSRSWSWSPSGRRYPSSQDRLDALMRDERERRRRGDRSPEREHARDKRRRHRRRDSGSDFSDEDIGNKRRRETRRSGYDDGATRGRASPGQKVAAIDPAVTPKVNDADRSLCMPRGGDIKGKGKEVDRGLPDTGAETISKGIPTPPTQSDVHLEQPQNDAPLSSSVALTSDVPPPARTDRKRVPRHRNLLQSVQAHLAPPPSRSYTRPEQKYPNETEAAPFAAHAASSSMSPTRVPAAPNMPPHDADGPGQSQMATASPHAGVANTESPQLDPPLNAAAPPAPCSQGALGDSAYPSTTLDTTVGRQAGAKMSAPEIMARTRARLAKLKMEADTDAGTPPADSSHAPAPTQARADPRADPAGPPRAAGTERPAPPAAIADAGSGNPDAAGACAGSAPADLRARLLGRLEHERRQVTAPRAGAEPGPAPSIDDRSSPSPAAPAPPAASREAEIGPGGAALGGAGTADIDADTLEARLRARARVRVRLAHAKRT